MKILLAKQRTRNMKYKKTNLFQQIKLYYKTQFKKIHKILD